MCSTLQQCSVQTHSHCSQDPTRSRCSCAPAAADGMALMLKKGVRMHNEKMRARLGVRQDADNGKLIANEAALRKARACRWVAESMQSWPCLLMCLSAAPAAVS